MTFFFFFHLSTRTRSSHEYGGSWWNHKKRVIYEGFEVQNRSKHIKKKKKKTMKNFQKRFSSLLRVQQTDGLFVQYYQTHKIRPRYRDFVVHRTRTHSEE